MWMQTYITVPSGNPDFPHLKHLTVSEQVPIDISCATTWEIVSSTHHYSVYLLTCSALLQKIRRSFGAYVIVWSRVILGSSFN